MSRLSNFIETYRDGTPDWEKNVKEITTKKSSVWLRICRSCGPYVCYEVKNKYVAGGDTFYTFWQSLKDMVQMPCDRCERRFFIGFEFYPADIKGRFK